MVQPTLASSYSSSSPLHRLLFLSRSFPHFEPRQPPSHAFSFCSFLRFAVLLCFSSFLFLPKPPRSGPRRRRSLALSPKVAPPSSRSRGPKTLLLRMHLPATTVPRSSRALERRTGFTPACTLCSSLSALSVRKLLVSGIAFQ